MPILYLHCFVKFIITFILFLFSAWVQNPLVSVLVTVDWGWLGFYLNKNIPKEAHEIEQVHGHPLSAKDNETTFSVYYTPKY